MRSVSMVFGLTVLALAAQAGESGLAVGETVLSFSPKHVAGPFKNTDTCTT